MTARIEALSVDPSECLLVHDELEGRTAPIGRRPGALMTVYACPACPWTVTAITRAPARRRGRRWGAA